MNLNKKVALAICRAQASSNGGKTRDYDPCAIFERGHAASRREYEDFRKGYAKKDREIRKAIRLILKTPKSGFFFSVKESKVNFEECLIVYFDFVLDGEKRQVSFHTFDFVGLERFVSSGHHRTKWDRRNSEDAVRALEEKVLHGTYKGGCSRFEPEHFVDYKFTKEQAAMLRNL